MPDAPSLSPLLQYQPWLMLTGCSLLLLAAIWFGAIFWLTRRCPPKVLATLPSAPTPLVDIQHIKERYLGEIAQIERSFIAREISSRRAHQLLSQALRTFASCASRSPLQSMTLTELKKTQHHSLADTIGSYYQPEFAAIATGSVEAAAAAARKVIWEWH